MTLCHFLGDASPKNNQDISEIWIRCDAENCYILLEISFLQDEEKAEKAASGVIAVGEANLGHHIVERSERSACFRVKMSDPGIDQ